jgi:hypothetical protein
MTAPFPDILAETVSRTLLAGFLGLVVLRQSLQTMGANLFHILAKLCGIHLTRTSPHHPAANGHVERLHRTLKAAIMCHADNQ